MKKLLAIMVLGFLFCVNAYAKPVLLACLDEDPSPGSTSNDYFSLDFDRKRIVTTMAVHRDFNWMKIAHSAIKKGK